MIFFTFLGTANVMLLNIFVTFGVICSGLTCDTYLIITEMEGVEGVSRQSTQGG